MKKVFLKILEKALSHYIAVVVIPFIFAVIIGWWGKIVANWTWPGAIFIGVVTLTCCAWIIDKVIHFQKINNKKEGTSTQLPPPQPILTKPKKFYSEHNKSDLADALKNLSEIINKDGYNITEKSQKIIEEWRLPGIADIVRGKELPDIVAIIDQLDDISNLTTNLHQKLFKDNGFIEKYQIYNDELCPILQINKNDSLILDHPIIELQSAINWFRNYLSSIQLAEKYNDLNLIKSMVGNSMLHFEKYRNSINFFKKWLNETKKRIYLFRDSQL